jgi:hypothetical protein
MSVTWAHMPFAASDAYFRLQEPTTGSASGTGTTRAVSMPKTLVEPSTLGHIGRVNMGNAERAL